MVHWIRRKKSNILATQQKTGFPHIISYNKVLLIWLLINRLFNLTAVWQNSELPLPWLSTKKAKISNSFKGYTYIRNIRFFLFSLFFMRALNITFSEFTELLRLSLNWKTEENLSFFPLPNSLYGELTGMMSWGKRDTQKPHRLCPL